MIGAHVKVAPETLKQAGMLTIKRKRELRNEAVLAVIRSRPSGTRIKLREFMAVTHIKQDGIMHSHIKTMLKNGLITRYQVGKDGHAYDIPSDTKVHKALEAPKPLHIVTNGVRDDKPTQADEIELLAMKFAWQAPDETRNNLHEFIYWLKKEDKNNV